MSRERHLQSLLCAHKHMHTQIVSSQLCATAASLAFYCVLVLLMHFKYLLDHFHSSSISEQSHDISVCVLE